MCTAKFVTLRFLEHSRKKIITTKIQKAHIHEKISYESPAGNVSSNA